LGISEARWTGSGRITLSRGQTVLYLGRGGNQQQDGVALMLNKEASKALLEWNPVSSRILKARFDSRFVKLSIIQCYAPTNEAEEETQDLYYEWLQTVVDKVSKHDLLLVMGDVNAKVGCNNQGRESYMGRFGKGEMNENGGLFAHFCGLNNLVIGGTIFPHRNIHKNIWVSPDRRTTNQIDHVTINKRWRSSLLDTRVYRGADVGSDHYLVVANNRLKQRRVSKPSTRRKLAVDHLKDETTQNNFCLNLQNKYEVLEDTLMQEEETGINIEDLWGNIRDAFIKTGEETLGYSRQKRKEWNSLETWGLIDERKELRKKMISAH